MNNLLAALMFFTRLPFWRICTVPSECFRHVVSYWSLCGWLTGGVMALSFWVFSTWFPLPVAVLLALCARLFLTGALHEDGLADFFDGFGGGRTKVDILRIMKDSHAGSYSVLGLIFYFLLLISTLYSLPAKLIPMVILAADPLSKFITSIMMNLLPYARPESESKSKTVYEKQTWWKLSIAFAAGVAPVFYYLPANYSLVIIIPTCLMIFIYFLAKKKIQGYTGDVCGATALLCELSFYLGILAISKFIPFSV